MSGCTGQSHRVGWDSRWFVFPFGFFCISKMDPEESGNEIVFVQGACFCARAFLRAICVSFVGRAAFAFTQITRVYLETVHTRSSVHNKTGVPAEWRCSRCGIKTRLPAYLRVPTWKAFESFIYSSFAARLFVCVCERERERA